MVRPLNQDVRSAVLSAARAVFAEAGYRGATMAMIAERAGVSTGNIYRYFAHKDALFDAVLPEEIVASFTQLVTQRVDALAQAPSLTNLNQTATERAEELLQFWIKHRLAVVTLLDRAEGSKHEGFAETFAELLERPLLAQIQNEAPQEQLSPATRFVLRTLFRNTVRMIVAILDIDDNEARIREAFHAFWSYQLAGLAGFSKWARHA